MEIKESYYFSPQDFDINGKRISDGVPFREVLRTFECDFHTLHPNYYALYLFANRSTMLLLSKSCNAKSNMIYGMELIDSDFDPNTNHQIEEASNKKNIVVYCIDSAYMLPDKKGLPKLFDEKTEIYPLTLLIDSELKDGVLHLEYLDGDDDNDKNSKKSPINVDGKSFKLI